jgi:hypothetical protein
VEVLKKMNFYRKTIKNAPSVISIPKELRNRDVEIIILPLEEEKTNGEIEVDKNGYPIGFFEETAGSLADDPIERAPQGKYEIREEIG